MEHNKILINLQSPSTFSDDIILNEILTNYYLSIVNSEHLPQFSRRKNMPTMKSACRYWMPLYKELCRVKQLTSNNECFCLACGISVEPELAHIIPRIYGGIGHVTNIIPLCNICHKHFDKHFDLSPNNKIEIHEFFQWLVERKLSDIITHLIKRHYLFIKSITTDSQTDNLTPKFFISKYMTEITKYKKECFPLFYDENII